MAMYCIIYIILNFAFVALDASNNKIIEGQNSKILNNPFMVSIEYQGAHNCGGSIIKPNLVLTAAHCFYDINNIEVSLDDLSVRVGTAIKEQGGQTAKISNKCEHPKYKLDTFVDYDEAVAILGQSLLLNPRTQIIQLQPKGIIVPDNSIGKVTGWGYVKNTFGEETTSTVLQELKMSKINVEICKATSLLAFTDRFTCFGSGIGSASFCNGDSGGPLVVDGKQVGIVSFSVGCGLPLFFQNFYTRVEHEEIRNHIDQCVTKHAI